MYSAHTKSANGSHDPIEKSKDSLFVSILLPFPRLFGNCDKVQDTHKQVIFLTRKKETMDVEIRKVQSPIKNTEWLEMATDDANLSTAVPHGNVSCDKVMIFAIDGSAEPCQCEDKEFHNKVNKQIEEAEKREFSFALDSQRLLQILSLVTVDSDYVRFFVKDGKSSIVISDEQNCCMAVIMPIDNVDKELHIPRM